MCWTDQTLPDEMKWLFPEYEFQTIRLDTHQGVIIERVLEKGSWQQIRWLFSFYGEKQVVDWLQIHGFRLLTRRSFALWTLALDIEKFEAADWAIEAKGFNPW